MSQATFVVNVTKEADGKMRVTIAPTGSNAFEFLMCAAEYMLAVAAMNSRAGFDEALQLLVKGAQTYKTATLSGPRESLS